ncbi:MAG: STAS domain-containing protein [Gallionella sp.]|nr:STAS domain-containing protein [Gallionella sp.]
MSINVQINERSGRIAMSGRFGFALHRDFKNAYSPLIDNAAVHEIEVEMSNVEYMDSAALGMLILLNEQAKAANKAVSLLNASGTVQQVLHIANFSKLFNIRHDA